MKKKIDEYMRFMNNMSLDNISYEYIYKELICHKDRDLSKCDKDIDSIFNNISEKIMKYVKLEDDMIYIFNTDNIECGKKIIELSIFNRLEYINENIEKLIEYLNKKKINFCGKLRIYDNVGYLSLNVFDIDNVLNIVDYVNCKLNKNIYSANPLFFSNGKVMISFCGNYSYIEILTMYLYRFILEKREMKKEIDYDSFKNYMVDNYSKIDNQIDMYKYIEFNKKNDKLSDFYLNLDIITNIIMYLFNGNDYDEFKDYYRKLNRKNSKCVNKYGDYDDIDDCEQLFEEIITSMYLNYGEEYTKSNIVNYMNTGRVDFITRKDNLRKRVITSKKFMIYLQKISFDEEFDKIIKLIKFNNNKKILENVCREIFLSYFDDNSSLGKIQVARALIRMEYGDYSAVTRNNDARKIAIENIVPSEVIDLIKGALCIDKIIKEEELYELYADYIEQLCIG